MYCIEDTGTVFKRNGFNNNKSKKEPIVRDHALLNANEDDEMVSQDICLELRNYFYFYI